MASSAPSSSPWLNCRFSASDQQGDVRQKALSTIGIGWTHALENGVIMIDGNRQILEKASWK